MLLLLSLVDPIRDTLQARVDQLSGWVNWATATVGAGVALEAIEPIHDFIAWAKFRKRESAHIREIAEFFPVSRNKPKYPSPPHPAWLKWCGRIGVIMVVAGVVGEWRCGAKLEDAHNAVHEYDIAKLTAADEKARNAAESAKTARAEADAATLASGEAQEKAGAAEATARRANKLAGLTQAEAQELTIRLLNAANQLAQVERRVRTQGPRWQSFEDNKSEFIESLKPFAGSITIVGCGPIASHEQTRVAADLHMFLGGEDGAGWKVTDAYWPQCSTFGLWGFLVVWSESASSEVNNSGAAVMSALWKLSFPAFGWRTSKSALGGIGASADSPIAKSAFDPTTIFVVVAPNSEEDKDNIMFPPTNAKPKAK